MLIDVKPGIVLISFKRIRCVGSFAAAKLHAGGAAEFFCELLAGGTKIAEDEEGKTPRSACGQTERGRACWIGLAHEAQRLPMILKLLWIEQFR